MPGTSSRPRRRLAILTCMDVTIDPLPLLGLERGDVHVIRNAGGLVTDDAVRSLSASQRLLGTEEVIVVMHEDCGLCGASDEDFAAELGRRRAPNRRGGWAASPTSSGRARGRRAPARQRRAAASRQDPRGRFRPARRNAARAVGGPPSRGRRIVWPAMRAVTFQAPGEVGASRSVPSPSCSTRRRDRADRGDGRVRLGPAHLPRPREDRAGLHDRPRVRRHRRRGRRRGDARGGRRPRARLLPDRLRGLLVLPSRSLPQLPAVADVRPRRDARLAAGHAGRHGARASRRPRAAARARGHEQTTWRCSRAT